MTTGPRQPRERSVPCRYCARPTWNTDAICGRHAADRAALEAVEKAHAELDRSIARHPAGKRIPQTAEVASYQAKVRALRDQQGR